MPVTLVVLGAGDLGGAVADRAAQSPVIHRVILVDDATDVARGKALDIRQAGPVRGGGAAIEGTSDLSAAVGAAVVVLADRHGGAGEWRGDDAVRQLVAVRTLAPEALLLCAGGSQLDVVDRLVLERGASPRRVAGTAPEALRSAATALTALQANVSPRDVSLTVLGRRPALFVPWSGASIAGVSAPERLDPPALTRLEARLARVWPPGPLSLAAAVIRAVDLALSEAPGVAVLHVVPQGATPSSGLALPVRLGRKGVGGTEVPPLAPKDRVRLDAAFAG